jgi:hypothetical protein
MKDENSIRQIVEHICSAVASAPFTVRKPTTLELKRIRKARNKSLKKQYKKIHK